MGLPEAERMNKHGPSPKTIKRVVEYLNETGLSVYGASTDDVTGEQGPGCQDFDADRVLVYRKLYRSGKLHHERDS